LITWEPALGAEVSGLPPLPEETPAPVKGAMEIPILLVLAAVITFLVKSLLGQAFYIPSESMVPQLHVNDRVVVSKISYRIHEPRRGDIVVFVCPPVICPQPKDDSGFISRTIRGLFEGVGLVQPSTDDYIKRVIGLPGDVVEGKEGRVYVNGKLLVEPYLQPERAFTTPFPAVTVGPDELWVMGDNRISSSDSRVFGPIKQSSVVGRTILKVWPLGDASFL
jgi:signal peptidase I